MVKNDIANEISEKTGLSLTKASQALEEVIALLKETLSEGETVKLTGFGTFVVRKRAERKGRNLQTGKEIPVQGKWAVTFKACDNLKAMVNNEKRGI